MRRFLCIALGCALTAIALAQDQLPAPGPSTQPVVETDPMLGKIFRSRTAGIEFNPPADGAMIRDLNSGEIVRFVYSDETWDVRVKPISLHISLELSAPPDKGVLELSARQLTDTNPTAKILRQDVIGVNGQDVGLIEARYNAGTDQVFAQQAIFSDFHQTRQQYYSVQLTSKGKPANAPPNQVDPDEARASEVFQHMLKSVHALDQDKLAQEQLLRVYNTREFWLLLDQKAILASIQPLHFMRVVRDGREVGFIQVNEREAKHNGNDGVEIIIHSHIQVADQANNRAAGTGAQSSPAAAPTATVLESTGIVLPKSIAPTTNAVAQAAAPQDLYTYSTFFVTFDRNHEDWTSITQTDENVGTQMTEDGTSDNAIRHKPDLQHRDKILEDPDYELDVTYEIGHAHTATNQKQRPFDAKLPPFYLPQGLGQLLPRLLPTDHHAQYMFAFYVGGQRNIMGRYVDVQSPREVELEGQKVEAVPITDRIGADGFSTTHYVNRNGEWLGSVSEDSRLQVFPTDEHTLRGLWPGFAVAPEPPAFVEMPTKP